MKRKLLMLGLLTMLTLAMLALAACGSTDNGGTTDNGGQTADGGDGGRVIPADGPVIKVGSKTFTENILLGRIAYDYLNYLGYPCEEQIGFGEMAFLRAALASGELSMYWEYNGTILMNYIQDEPIYDGAECYRIVKDWDKENNDIVWLDMSDINNTYAMVIRKDTQEKYNVTTMSEFAEVIKSGEPIRICAAEDYLTRADSYPRVQEVYGYTHPKENQITIMGLSVEALKNGESELWMATTTDPKIIAYDLFILEDDKHAFPPYNAGITIRQDILDAYPNLADDLNYLTGLITMDVIMDLNGRVDLDGDTEEVVSKEWLQSMGLIE